MTPVQLASASKTSLLTYIEELQKGQQEAQAQAQNAIQIANYFSTVITGIESLLLNSPFINKDGKFFKKLFWVLANFAAIKTVIEDIINTIKDWRKQVENLVKQQQAANQNSDSTPSPSASV